MRVTQGVEYALIMPRYFFNNAEYAWRCLYVPEEIGSKYGRILNLSDAVHSIRSLYNNWAVNETEIYLEHCQTVKMERFA